MGKNDSIKLLDGDQNDLLELAMSVFRYEVDCQVFTTVGNSKFSRSYTVDHWEGFIPRPLPYLSKYGIKTGISGMSKFQVYRNEEKPMGGTRPVLKLCISRDAFDPRRVKQTGVIVKVVGVTLHGGFEVPKSGRYRKPTRQEKLGDLFEESSSDEEGEEEDGEEEDGEEEDEEEEDEQNKDGEGKGTDGKEKDQEDEEKREDEKGKCKGEKKKTKRHAPATSSGGASSSSAASTEQEPQRQTASAKSVRTTESDDKLLPLFYRCLHVKTYPVEQLSAVLPEWEGRMKSLLGIIREMRGIANVDFYVRFNVFQALMRYVYADTDHLELSKLTLNELAQLAEAANRLNIHRLTNFVIDHLMGRLKVNDCYQLLVYVHVQSYEFVQPFVLNKIHQHIETVIMSDQLRSVGETLVQRTLGLNEQPYREIPIEIPESSWESDLDELLAEMKSDVVRSKLSLALAQYAQNFTYA